jgi:poly(3-hydroxybutyrate) depolymerase
MKRSEARLHNVNGRAATRTVVADEQGAAVLEYWVIEGAGHAWSGGKATGSYADVHGPDASAAMVAFFLGQSAAMSPQ